MEPFFWPIAAPGPSHFTKVNADGSIALPEPYKPKYLKRSLTAPPVSGQLTREQANKRIDDYFARLENEILEVINNQLNKGIKMNTTNKPEQTFNAQKQQMLERLNGMNKKINMALAKAKGPIRAGSFFTGDGTLLEFGDEVIEFTDVHEGSEAKVDGKPAEGEYVMPDGVKLTFKKGKVTEIKGMVKNRLPYKPKRKPSGKRIPFHKPSK